MLQTYFIKNVLVEKTKFMLKTLQRMRCFSWSYNLCLINCNVSELRFCEYHILNKPSSHKISLTQLNQLFISILFNISWEHCLSIQLLVDTIFTQYFKFSYNM